MRNFLLLYFLLTGYCVLAQQDIIIGKKYSLQSGILNEKREFWVYLPPDYYSKNTAPASFPVVYLLDGDATFHSFTGVAQYLAKGPYQVIPQMIVVGILNTDRTRDLTPTAAGRTAFYDNRTSLYRNSGGNETFVQFLQKELKPFVDSAFHTSGYNILTGHSFGGLAATNILLQHTRLFNAYIIIDPSLWWDDMLMIKQADTILSKKDFDHTAVYIAKAWKEITPYDTTTDHQRSIDAFKTLLQQKQPQNLRWAFQYYANDDHGTVSIPASFDGLKYIFSGYMVNVKKAIAEPSIVAEQFAALSGQLGFSFQPEESWLVWMGNYALHIGKAEAALYFFKKAVALYPSSSNACIGLGGVYEKEGNKEEAKKWYKKALSLSSQKKMIQEKIQKLN